MNGRKYAWSLVAASSLALSWWAVGVASDNTASDVTITSVYKLRSVDADSVVDKLRGILPAITDAKGIKITADQRQNAIIVLAPKEVQETVKRLLELMDRRGGIDGKALADLSEREIEKLSESDLRKFVLALSKQVRQLEDRVQRLEAATSLRHIPIAGPAK